MTMRLSIRDILQTSIWVSDKDGQKVFDILARALREDGPVELSFEGREKVITAFLNVAIGQIYADPNLVEALKAKLTLVDADQSDLSKVKLVVENAKRYFADKNMRNDHGR